MGITVRDKLTRNQLEQVAPALRKLYKAHYGENYNAFYAWAPGSCHTKLLVLVYPDFLRLVITSCNMMDTDTVLGDNHWYIHDLPRRMNRSTSPSISGFEADLLEHLEGLGTPDNFIKTVRGLYDYSSVKVHLVTSVPGTHSAMKAEKYGLLRLRSVVKGFGLRLPREQVDGKLDLETCTASIGNLNAKWLNTFHDCALGRRKLSVYIDEDNLDNPKLRIIYPSVQDVKRCHSDSQEVRSKDI